MEMVTAKLFFGASKVPDEYGSIMWVEIDFFGPPLNLTFTETGPKLQKVYFLPTFITPAITLPPFIHFGTLQPEIRQNEFNNL